METMTATPAASAASPAPAVSRISDPGVLEQCDRCAAAALWRVRYITGELLFCGHHARGFGFAGEDSHAAYLPLVKGEDKKTTRKGE